MLAAGVTPQDMMRTRLERFVLFSTPSAGFGSRSQNWERRIENKFPTVDKLD